MPNPLFRFVNQAVSFAQKRCATSDGVTQLYRDKLAELEAEFNNFNVIIVSDHGMTEGKLPIINLNQWLIEEGYLVVSDDNTDEDNVMTRIGPWI